MRLSPLKLLDNIATQSRIIIVGNKTYVVKNYSNELGLLKWYLLNIPARGIYPFKTAPLTRLKREIEYMKNAPDYFRKPEILLIDYTDLSVVREYVPGETYGPDSPPFVHSYMGMRLGQLHRSGWALGDVKISNFIYTSSGDIYIIDAEQATRESNTRYYAWDLLVLLSTLTIDGYNKFLVKASGYTKMIKDLLEGYLKGGEDVAINVIEMLKTLDEFKLIEYLLIPFPYNYLLIRVLDNLKHVD
ncbi:MAG: hypothetical protein QXP02_05715 [Desulfurococcaceae archaeon]